MKFEGELPSVPNNVVKFSKKKFDNGHWHFCEQMGGKYAEKNCPVGFIYVIRDNYLERFYLGKKTFFGNGISNKGKESNWRTYFSSSKALAEMFKERPMEEFDFICLEQYKTKGTLSYSETWSLCFVEAPTNTTWYNTLIEKVSWNVKEPITQRHKDRLADVIKMKKFEEQHA